MLEASRMSSSAQRREHHCISQQRSVQRRPSEELCGGEESRTGGWGPWFHAVRPGPRRCPSAALLAQLSTVECRISLPLQR